MKHVAIAGAVIVAITLGGAAVLMYLLGIIIGASLEN